MPAPLKSYIERILNVLAEIDGLGGDKKEIYKELAGDGYDRSVVSQVVGHIRKKAAKPGKFAEQSVLFDLYLTEYEGVGTPVATHAAREQAEHGQVTGGVYPSDATMRPQTAGHETAVANSQSVAGLSAPFTQDGFATSSAGTEGEADRQPITDRSKPNPWCLDPEECGLSSWEHFCGRCQRVKAERQSVSAVQ